MGDFLDKIKEDLDDIGLDLFSDVEAFGAQLYQEARKLASSHVTNLLERQVGARPGTIRDALNVESRRTRNGFEVRISLDPTKLGTAKRIIFGGRKWRPNDILTAALRRTGLPFGEE
jgi:hypothetical protein